MKITRIDSYRDGGTISIETDEGQYCIDNRIRSKTIGKLYVGYPKHDNSNIDHFQNEMKKIIFECLDEYKTSEPESWNKWNSRIHELLN